MYVRVQQVREKARILREGAFKAVFLVETERFREPVGL